MSARCLHPLIGADRRCISSSCRQLFEVCTTHGIYEAELAACPKCPPPPSLAKPAAAPSSPLRGVRASDWLRELAEDDAAAPSSPPAAPPEASPPSPPPPPSPPNTPPRVRGGARRRSSR